MSSRRAGWLAACSFLLGSIFTCLLFECLIPGLFVSTTNSHIRFVYVESNSLKSASMKQKPESIQATASSKSNLSNISSEISTNNSSSSTIKFTPVIPLSPTLTKKLFSNLTLDHLDGSGFRIKKFGETSDKPIVLGAGRGTTGTKYMAELVGNITGKPVTHYHNYNNMNKTELHRWIPKWLALGHLNRTTAQSFNYSFLGDWAGHFDVPIPNLFPYIFSYFPNSKVILTVRNSTEWVKKRGDRWRFRRAPAPFAMEMTGTSYMDAVNVSSKRSKVSMGTMYNENKHTTEILYLAYNAMVKAIVPEKQLLIVDVFKEPNAQIEKRVRNFLADIL